ncbi:MAG TPA: SAM-dependent methyltransferase [Micromonosporaceae bacterium]|nr:SAM-dependent methyltransferase [Micromonosporaceae bacterium]HCU48591.1 SAM-dependent methyltransferase [Micromonosporaceae bacterium]
MTAPMDAQEADRALKTKHRAMWALGDYPAVAAEVVQELGPVLVQACGVGPDQRVLDVAAGAGNAAIPAALAGAEVTASDLTPELLEAGQRIAAQHGAKLQWEQADAEALPYDNDDFDVVMSSVGVMFAPHHQATADELVRVCRPGGTIGLINWTPEGFIGQMFATMKPYAAPPPPGAQPPPLWGNQDHVTGLFGDRITDVTAERKVAHVDRFATGEEFRDYFKAQYGPTIATYRNIAEDPEKVAALDRDLAELGRRFDLGSGKMEWEYLLFTARKAGS